VCLSECGFRFSKWNLFFCGFHYIIVVRVVLVVMSRACFSPDHVSELCPIIMFEVDSSIRIKKENRNMIMSLRFGTALMSTHTLRDLNYFTWFISVINHLDAQNFCFTISLFHASTCYELICSKHVQAWNKLIVKQKFCASSWLITEIKCWDAARSAKRQNLFHVSLFWVNIYCPLFVGAE